MPFEIPQKTAEPEIKIGRFQKFADALMAGCAVTTPLYGSLLIGEAACALGAMYIGETGRRDLHEACDYIQRQDVRELRNAYQDAYKWDIEGHNDSKILTREQIAARIAAL